MSKEILLLIKYLRMFVCVHVCMCVAVEAHFSCMKNQNFSNLFSQKLNQIIHMGFLIQINTHTLTCKHTDTNKRDKYNKLKLCTTQTHTHNHFGFPNVLFRNLHGT